MNAKQGAVAAPYGLLALERAVSVAQECDLCDGTGLSPVAGLWAAKWHGVAPFDPHETGSTPCSPRDLNIYEAVRKRIENSGQFPWWFNQAGAKDLSEAIYIEAVRSCKMWNSAWRFHLDQDDVLALWANGYPGGGALGTGWSTTDDVNRAGLAEHGWYRGMGLWACLPARAERMGFDLWCGHCDRGLMFAPLLPG